MQGWIKLHRQFTEWEWYDDNNTKSLFIHLLLKANHKETTWRGEIVKRGDVLTGSHKLVSETGMTRQQIRTSLNKLKDTNELTIKSTNKFSLITLCKYDSYQSENDSSNQQSNQPLTNEQPSSNQQVTTSKNVKKEKNVNNEKKTSAPKKSLKELMEVLKGNYSSDILNDFYRYWTEPNSTGKERWTLERTWSTKGRLTTWGKNQTKFNGNKKSYNGSPKKEVELRKASY